MVRRTVQHLQEKISRIREVSSSLPENELFGSCLADIEKILNEVLDRIESLRFQAAILDSRTRGLENNLILRIWRKAAWELKQRIAITPLYPSRTDSLTDYPVWVEAQELSFPTAEVAKQSVRSWRYHPRFLIFISNSENQAAPTVDSVRRQVYSHWELHFCSAPNKSDEPGKVTAAAKKSDADYLVYLTRETRLHPLALYFIAETLQSEIFDVAYTDEDFVNIDGQRYCPLFKPDWSPALLRHRMYIGSPIVVRREWLLSSGDLPRGCFLGSFQNLILHSMQHSVVRHIPTVLSHRLSQATSEPEALQQLTTGRGRLGVVVCSRTPHLLERCLRSLSATAAERIEDVVVVAHEGGARNTELRDVIHRNGAKCVSYNGPFNFSVMNNLGAEQTKSRLLLFLNDDVYFERPGWIELMIDELEQPATAIVGALLRYPSGCIQHAGLVVGIHDGVAHVGRGLVRSELWPWLVTTRNVSAVTGACLAIRSEVFKELGGFDPLFPNNYNDVDLCLRARARGWLVVCVATQGVVHTECGTRSGGVLFGERQRFLERWASVLFRGDPYYSPNLAPTEDVKLCFELDRISFPGSVATPPGDSLGTD